MRSLRQNREQIAERAHDAGDQLRETKDRLKGQATVQIKELKAGLHRRPSGGGGQWKHQDPDTWNAHQKIANRTKGYVTLANGVSLAGAALTAYGVHKAANQEYAKATIFMGIGRFCDLMDGKIAEKTGTMSDTGAGVDAGLDKLLAAFALYTFVKSGHISRTEALLHSAQQTAIFAESALIQYGQGEPNPGESGKRGMAALWLRVGGVVLENALSSRDHQAAAAYVGFASEVASVTALHENQTALNEYHEDRIELFRPAAA
jgi:phosphatidylglycerophosphate synthase